MDLRELYEARDGLPTEDRAARKIATFAVIPAAMLGLLAATRLVGLADPIEQLLLVCTAAAFGAGFSMAFLVLGLYSLFGFRPVAVFADALVGVFWGFLIGAMVTLLLMWRRIVHHDHALWALLLIPLGAVAVPLYRAWSAMNRADTDVEQAAEPPAAEPDDEREPPMARVLKF